MPPKPSLSKTKRKPIPLLQQIQSAYLWICLAEANYFVCREIQDWKRTHNEGGHDVLLLAANNAFQAAVETVHALVCSEEKADLRLSDVLTALARSADPDPSMHVRASQMDEELRRAYPHLGPAHVRMVHALGTPPFDETLRGVREAAAQKGLEDLEKIKDLFEKGKFHRYRHQTIAHKNPRVPFPMATTHMTVFPSVLDEFGEVIKELRVKASMWFNWSPTNPALNPLLEQTRQLIEKMGPPK
jgi:hypothetical protein